MSRTLRGRAAAADEELAKLVAEVSDPNHLSPSRTVGDLLDRWLDSATVLKDLSPTTVREHRRTIKKNLRPHLGAVELHKLDGGMLDSLYASLRSRERPLASASVRRVHAVVSAACNQGAKWGWLKSNPAEQATPPPVRQASTVAPRVEEVQAMITAAERDDHDMAVLIALAAVTGARRGELVGLRWGDVDWNASTLTIKRAMAVIEGEWISKSTKTHAGRVLALDEFGLEVLRRHLRVAEDRADDLGVAFGPELPILSYDLQRPISPDTCSHYVRVIASRVGVNSHLHALRHFAATQMISGGHDVRTVANRLGHKDASTTLRVYSHALPERDRDAAAFLGRVCRVQAMIRVATDFVLLSDYSPLRS